MQSSFRDRREAGWLLADKLASRINGSDALVLGLPRGGVLVASAIARSLGARLDVFVVRKLDVPGRSDQSMGLIAAGGVRIVDEATLAERGIPRGKVDEAARREALELARLERYYREGRPAPRMTGRTIVLVDDGSTPPAMLERATDALLAYRPARAIVAVPAADGARCAELVARMGDVVCAVPSNGTLSPSLYEDDDVPSDRDIRNILSQSPHRDQPHRLAG
jgi:predicted phosphoribosyltransferase